MDYTISDAVRDIQLDLDTKSNLEFDFIGDYEIATNLVMDRNDQDDGKTTTAIGTVQTNRPIHPSKNESLISFRSVA